MGEGTRWRALQPTPASRQYQRNSALSLLPALPRLLLAALSWLLAWLLLSAAALLAAALLAALILLAWLLFVGVHNCSYVSSLPTTKPRPLSFLWRLVRKRTKGPIGRIALALPS
jgi:hypothetical protein